MKFSKTYFRQGEREPRITGIAGAGRGTGVTHLALMLANYLRGACGRKTAALEWNGHGDFGRFGKMCTGQAKAKDRYRIQDVDYYPQAGGNRLLECMQAGYQEVVIDFGGIGELEPAEFMRCGAVWIVMSFSEWQMDAFWALAELKESAGRRGWQFFTAFGSEESRRQWNKRRKPEVVRIPFSADAFTVTRAQMDWMETALSQGSFSDDVSQKRLRRKKRRSQ